MADLQNHLQRTLTMLRSIEAGKTFDYNTFEYHVIEAEKALDPSLSDSDARSKFYQRVP